MQIIQMIEERLEQISEERERTLAAAGHLGIQVDLGTTSRTKEPAEKTRTSKKPKKPVRESEPDDLNKTVSADNTEHVIEKSMELNQAKQAAEPGFAAPRDSDHPGSTTDEPVTSKSDVTEPHLVQSHSGPASSGQQQADPDFADEPERAPEETVDPLDLDPMGTEGAPKETADQDSADEPEGTSEEVGLSDEPATMSEEVGLDGFDPVEMPEETVDSDDPDPEDESVETPEETVSSPDDDVSVEQQKGLKQTELSLNAPAGTSTDPDSERGPSMINESDVVGPARPERVDFSYDSLKGEPVEFNPISEESALNRQWPDSSNEARQILIDIVYSRPGTSISELSFFLNTTNFHLKPALEALEDESVLREEANLYFPKRPGIPANTE